MIAMGGICGPIGIRTMRRYNPDAAARFRDAIKLADECDHVGHVLDDMTTDDFVELIVGERIGNVAEIMNDVGMGLWIGIDADRAGHFVPATTYVENFFRLGRSAHLT